MYFLVLDFFICGENTVNVCAYFAYYYCQNNHFFKTLKSTNISR